MADAGARASEGDQNPDNPHGLALKHANEAWTAESENFDNARDDQRFYAGEQWLADAKQERTQANRPCITINRIPGFVKQVTGDVRKDTPSVKIVPSKDGASEEVADIFSGLIRNIENQSNAKAAYVQATENACITGLGSFRVKTQYAGEDSFDQDIRIERLVDPFAVLYDPAARKPDKSDMRYCFVFVDMPKEVYEKEFPDKPISAMPSGPNAIQGLVWFSMESVRIAEYWYRKPVKKQLLELADGRVLDAKTALEEAKESGQPLDVVNKRTIKTDEICMRLMNGTEFLTEEAPWAGKYIPIIPVIGEEIYIEGRVVRRGMVRDAKDPQRVLNYMRTAAVEAAALQPKSPYMVSVNQIKGYESYFERAGSSNLPFIVYNPDPLVPGEPKRSPPALAQEGLDSQANLAGQDLQSVVGIYNVSLGAPSTEKSGVAIMARQKQGDTGTYNYIDNLATAIRHLGDILVDLIPKIYDTPRMVRILKEDGTGEMHAVNHPAGPDGMPVHPSMLGQMSPDEIAAAKKINDLSVGKYDVTAITGPSFATRRMEAREGMIELIRAMPQVMQKAADLVVRNMDFPGADDIAERLAPQPNPGPPPSEMSKVEKDLAQAGLFKAQTEAAQIGNIEGGLGLLETLRQMHMTMQAVQDQLAQGMAPHAAPAPVGLGPPAGAPPGGEAGPSGAPNPAALAELEPMPPNTPIPNQRHA